MCNEMQDKDVIRVLYTHFIWFCLPLFKVFFNMYITIHKTCFTNKILAKCHLKQCAKTLFCKQCVDKAFMNHD